MKKQKSDITVRQRTEFWLELKRRLEAYVKAQREKK